MAESTWWLMLTDDRYLGKFLWSLSCSVNEGGLYPNLMSGELPGLGEVAAHSKHTMLQLTTNAVILTPL